MPLKNVRWGEQTLGILGSLPPPFSSTSARLRRRRRRLADRASRSGRSRSIPHLALSDTRIPVHGRGQPEAPPRACRFLRLVSELHCCSRRVPAHREARSRQNAAGCCACTPTTTWPRARRSRQPSSRANSGEGSIILCLFWPRCLLQIRNRYFVRRQLDLKLVLAYVTDMRSQLDLKLGLATSSFNTS